MHRAHYPHVLPYLHKGGCDGAGALRGLELHQLLRLHEVSHRALRTDHAAAHATHMDTATPLAEPLRAPEVGT